MYIDKKELYYEILVSKAKGNLTKRAENMLLLMIKNVMRKFKYFNNDDRYDCTSEATYILFKNWYLYDPDKTEHVFAYYTEIIKRGAAKSLHNLYKQKGLDEKVTVYSIESMNDGDGWSGL